jgi:hypothetical protein
MGMSPKIYIVVDTLMEAGVLIDENDRSIFDPVVIQGVFLEREKAEDYIEHRESSEIREYEVKGFTEWILKNVDKLVIPNT